MLGDIAGGATTALYATGFLAFWGWMLDVAMRFVNPVMPRGTGDFFVLYLCGPMLALGELGLGNASVPENLLFVGLLVLYPIGLIACSLCGGFIAVQMCPGDAPLKSLKHHIARIQMVIWLGVGLMLVCAIGANVSYWLALFTDEVDLGLGVLALPIIFSMSLGIHLIATAVCFSIGCTGGAKLATITRSHTRPMP